MYVHIVLIRFRFLSRHLFGESAAHSVDHIFSLHYVLFFCDCSIFNFEDRICVLIAPIPGHCLLVTAID